MKIKKILTLCFVLYVLHFVFITSCYAFTKAKLLTIIYAEEEIGNFKQPQAIYLDEKRNKIYIADTLNHRLVSYHKKYYKFISQFNAEGRLKLPLCMLRDKEGLLIVNNKGENSVLIIDVKKKIIKQLALNDISPKPVPGNMKLDKEGYLYLIDKANKRILIFSPKEYKFLKQIKTKDATGFSDIALTEKYLYALDPLKKEVFIYEKNSGKFVRSLSLKNLAFPLSLAIDAGGNLYILDAHKCKVFVFDKNGNMISEIGRKGWKEGEFYYPRYVLLHKKQLYVVDTGNNRIQVFEIK